MFAYINWIFSSVYILSLLFRTKERNNLVDKAKLNLKKKYAPHIEETLFELQTPCNKQKRQGKLGVVYECPLS